jgi:hypothetical protein
MSKLSANIWFDEDGVAPTVEYILTFVVASSIFALLIMNFSPLFISSPQYIVTRNQLADIGNDVSTKVIDTYLVAPDDGRITTYFDIPGTVAAGYTYNVSVVQMTGKDQDDSEVSVFTADRSIYVNTTLSGAGLTIPISGNTTSTWYLHDITYDTNKQQGG